MTKHSIGIFRSDSPKTKYLDWIAGEEPLWGGGTIPSPHSPLPGSLFFYSTSKLQERNERDLKIWATQPSQIVFSPHLYRSVMWGRAMSALYVESPRTPALFNCCMNLPQPCVAVGIIPGQHTRTGVKNFLASLLSHYILVPQRGIGRRSVMGNAERTFHLSMERMQSLFGEFSDEEIASQSRAVKIAEVPLEMHEPGEGEGI